MHGGAHLDGRATCAPSLPESEAVLQSGTSVRRSGRLDVRSVSDRLRRSARFLTVGLLGIGVNQLGLWLASGVLGLHYLLGAVIASQGSTVFNFAGNELWVFRRRDHRGVIGRFVAFDVLNGVALAARVPLLFLLVGVAGMNYLIGNLAAIVLLTGVRFAVSDTVIWSR